jgi:hypothetical protein
VEPLREVIVRRFEGARARVVGARVHAEIAVDDVWYRARVEMAPEARVAVELPCTDGFELTLRWSDRGTLEGARAPRAPMFDDSFLVETNDLALAGVWLDHPSRDGLLASRYVATTNPDRRTALLYRDGAWTHEVSNDEVSAHRQGGEPSADRMADMLLASLMLAGRPVRWARAFRKVAGALGGDAAQRVEVGGKPALRVRRGLTDVLVHVVRRLGPGDPGRLRTVVGAHRHGSSGETLSLIAEGLPRAAWPPPTAPGRGALAIDARARHLLDAAQPSAITVRPHDVEIAFDGALADRVRLGAAIELAAWWAAGTAAAATAGPYR